MSDRLNVEEFLTGYLAEVEEHVQRSSANLLAVETAAKSGQTKPRAVRELFRSLHTIKGLSAMVGVEPIVELAHAMESVLREADRAGGALAPSVVEALLRALRAIDERVDDVAHRRTVRPVPPQVLDALAIGGAAENAPSIALPRGLDDELAAKLTPSERQELAAASSSGRRSVLIEFFPSPERAARGVTITTIREKLAAIADIVRVVPRSVPESEHAPGGMAFALIVTTDASAEALQEAASTSAEHVQTLASQESISTLPAPSLEPELSEPDDGGRHGFVRVEIARLNDALEKLSALVVTRFRLERAVKSLASRGVDVRELAAIAAENARELRDLRATIMRARMISVTEMLERIPLLVRGLAITTKKNVAVHIDAGKAELDKAVAERLFPAIVHLMRNAIDHGIESPEDRRRLGKPESGTIRVSGIERSSNQLELTISDDGSGVDREAVARRAGRELAANDGALLDMLAIPGLSTREAATRTSGRGMGVDIVQRIVRDDLGGELNVTSERGVGTTWTLRVPLTITIIDAFSFMCGERPFVVPVAIVDEIIELDPSRIAQGPGMPGQAAPRFFERRGEALSLIDLRTVLALGGPVVDTPKAIVVRRNGEGCAFAVDRMLGQQEVVVRPLVDPLVRVPGVSGSTDLGDGTPTLVLDLVALSGARAKKEVNL